jgi:hypothetical protein
MPCGCCEPSQRWCGSAAASLTWWPVAILQGQAGNPARGMADLLPSFEQHLLGLAASAAVPAAEARPPGGASSAVQPLLLLDALLAADAGPLPPLRAVSDVSPAAQHAAQAAAAAAGQRPGLAATQQRLLQLQRHPASGGRRHSCRRRHSCHSCGRTRHSRCQVPPSRNFSARKARRLGARSPPRWRCCPFHMTARGSGWGSAIQPLEG